MSTPVYGQDTIPIGGGEVAKIGGLIHIDTGAVGTTAVTTEEDLISYTMPGNTLLKNGQGVRVKAWGRLGANGNTKNIRLRFGSSAELLTTTVSGSKWVTEGVIFRSGIGAQDRFHEHGVGGTLRTINVTTPAEDETAAIIIKVTGQNGTAAANDIIADGLLVEFLNAE